MCIRFTPLEQWYPTITMYSTQSQEEETLMGVGLKEFFVGTLENKSPLAPDPLLVLPIGNAGDNSMLLAKLK